MCMPIPNEHGQKWSCRFSFGIQYGAHLNWTCALPVETAINLPFQRYVSSKFKRVRVQFLVYSLDWSKGTRQKESEKNASDLKMAANIYSFVDILANIQAFVDQQKGRAA